MASPNTKRDENKDSADLYSTPTIALDAIKPYLIRDIIDIANEKIGKNFHNTVEVLEPCAGLGAISTWLLGQSDSLAGKVTLLLTDNDLTEYNYETSYTGDFLSNDNDINEYDLIVTNPPYNKAVEFVLKGFEHAPIQWHFLRMSFLEGQKRFQDLFSLGKLSDVYIFTYRVSCPKGIDMEPSANSVCYAWYRFDKNYCGQPRLHWLTKANLGE